MTRKQALLILMGWVTLVAGQKKKEDPDLKIAKPIDMVSGTDDGLVITQAVVQPVSLDFKLDGFKQLSVHYGGEVVTFTPKEIMDALSTEAAQ